MLTIFLFFVIVVTVPQVIRYIGFSKKVPERIAITDFSLQVDENSYSIREIDSISMTPADYILTNNDTSFRRRILIKLDAGQSEYS